LDAPGWNEGLSPEQETAASQSGSHARLLAGPGTGKTHTLARKVVYLVSELGVPPSEILVLTFTRLATRQLRTTIKRALAPLTEEMPYISTLHGFALRQLRRNAREIDSLPQPLRIADDREEERIIVEDMKRLLTRSKKQIKGGFADLSADWETLRADADAWMQKKPDAPFVGAWDEHRTIYGYTLRSELVYQLKRGLVQAGDFRLEPRFKYVLIDEFQDLNPCDLAIVEALATSDLELLACGDDDQRIYGFRHADPSGIRSFTATFPGAVELVLTECRRCDSNILSSALWVAEQDTRRVEKALHPTPGHEGGEVHLLRFDNGGAESAGVAAICEHLINEGTEPAEILILMRSDHQKALSGPVKQALEARQIAVAAGINKETPLDEREGRRFLSMLQLIINPKDHLAWRTRLETWGRVGPKTLEPIYEFARQAGVTFSDALRRLDEFEDQLRPPAPKLLNEVLEHTMQVIEQFSQVREEAVEGSRDEMMERLRDLVGAVAEHEIAEEEDRSPVLAYVDDLISASGATSLDDLLTANAVNREELEPEIDPYRVNMLTMHQAKGLSADAVIIIAVEDEILLRNTDAISVEENRRLLYVSMTRARHKLYMTYAARRTGRQSHLGRSTGQTTRQLTRYLKNSAIVPVSGEQFVDALRWN
jgi:DNA helicase II / ATP-dependent DNA helicase PcrA